jgi:hypothetical protein
LLKLAAVEGATAWVESWLVEAPAAGVWGAAEEGSWAAHTHRHNTIARHAGRKRGNPSPLL